MRCPLLLSALLLLGSLPVEAAAPVQRGEPRGRGEAAPRSEGPAGGRGAKSAKSSEGSEVGGRGGRAERVEVDVARARIRMTGRVRWLAGELKMGPAQRKRLQDLFELELWAGTARGVEPFPSEPDLTQPIPRTGVVKITRGEIEDREGLFADSPLAAVAGAGQADKDGGRGGEGRGDAGSEAEPATRRVPGSKPAATAGLTPAAAAALERYRAEVVELNVRTTHPMLSDLTVSTLDGVMPLLEAAQVAPYLELLGDEGLFLVRAHAAHRISGYSKLDQGVARLKPIPTKDWKVAPRKTTRGRGGRGGGGGRGGKNGGGRNGRGGQSRY